MTPLTLVFLLTALIKSRLLLPLRNQWKIKLLTTLKVLKPTLKVGVTKVPSLWRDFPMNLISLCKNNRRFMKYRKGARRNSSTVKWRGRWLRWETSCKLCGWNIRESSISIAAVPQVGSGASSPTVHTTCPQCKVYSLNISFPFRHELQLQQLTRQQSRMKNYLGNLQNEINDRFFTQDKPPSLLFKPNAQNLEPLKSVIAKPYKYQIMPGNNS